MLQAKTKKAIAVDQTGLIEKAEKAASLIHGVTIKYDRYCRAAGAVSDLYKRTEKFGKPFGIIVTGETGAGKTTTIEKLKKEFEPIRTDEKTLHPVVFINVPASPDAKFIYRAILDHMGVVPGQRATERQLREQAITVLKESEAKLIVADEVQHFVEKGVLKHSTKIADCFKSLMNEAKVSIAFFGLPYLRRLLQASSQLRRRFSETVEISGWNIENDDERKEFCGVIKGLIKHSGCKVKDDLLDESDAIERIYFATDGRIANLVTILAETIKLVTLSGKQEITLELLDEAFRAKIWYDVPSTRNPFSKDFRRGRLIYPNECYAEECE